MSRHVHYDVMMEWAADTSKAVQVLTLTGWKPADNPPKWNTLDKYRIKPAPKPDVVGYWFISLQMQSRYSERRGATHNLRLTFDGETGALKDAEILK